MPDQSISARLQSLWYRSAAPPLALRPLSWLFGLGVRMRRALYARGWLRIECLPRPVVVVGNLTVGGSGKTPLVIWLVGQLRAAGFAPGVVLRGFGGSAARGNEPLPVQTDSNAEQVGDEALLLRQRTGVPVAIGRNRVRAARLLLAQGVDVVVSDDGLQHLALARQFEIAVIDGERGLGNGYLLPAGPLREGPERLASVDAIVINGEGRYRDEFATGRDLPLRPLTMRLRGERLVAVGGAAETLPLSSLKSKRVHAVAGIGNPGRFFSQLRAVGLELIEHAFPDHHRFRPGELDFGDALPVLMTEKDAVKCRAVSTPQYWYLPVSAVFDEVDAAALFGNLRRALETSVRAKPGE